MSVFWGVVSTSPTELVWGKRPQLGNSSKCECIICWGLFLFQLHGILRSKALKTSFSFLKKLYWQIQVRQTLSQCDWDDICENYYIITNKRSEVMCLLMKVMSTRLYLLIKSYITNDKAEFFVLKKHLLLSIMKTLEQLHIFVETIIFFSPGFFDGKVQKSSIFQ